MGLEGNGIIRLQDRQKIIGYLNEALIRLHSRFILKESEVLIKMFPHITNYHLLTKYAQSFEEPEAEGYAYIMDLMGEPFVEDVIKILEVWNTNSFKYPLNDPEDRWSLYTPQANLLQVPYPIGDATLSVVYQAAHPIIIVGDPDNEITGSFEIPDVLYGALRAYIAYKVFSHMNTQESTAKGQEHLVTYERICAEVVDRDLVNTSISSTNTKFEKRGFV